MPGIGKSRLVAKLIDAQRDEAAVLSGRCLPYGQGITFWPIGEIVAQAAAIGDEDTLEMARAKLRSAVGEGDAAQVVATHVGEMVGLVPAASGRRTPSGLCAPSSSFLPGDSPSSSSSMTFNGPSRPSWTSSSTWSTGSEMRLSC